MSHQWDAFNYSSTSHSFRVTQRSGSSSFYCKFLPEKGTNERDSSHCCPFKNECLVVLKTGSLARCGHHYFSCGILAILKCPTFFEWTKIEEIMLDRIHVEESRMGRFKRYNWRVPSRFPERTYCTFSSSSISRTEASFW